MSAASPTALIATIFAARSAELGTRSLTVTDQGTETVFTDGFEIITPLSLENRNGTVTEGSIIIVEILQKDPGNPFDARSEGGEFNPV